MGFFDIFRRKKQEPEFERIKLNEIDSWLDNRKNQIIAAENKISDIIEEGVLEFIKELKEKMPDLENVDIEKKKAESKIKLLVKENLKNYMAYLRDLIENLKQIRDNKPSIYVEKLENLFSDFNKKSRMSFEKITILIGREIERIVDSIRNLSKALKKILKENENLVERSKIILEIEDNRTKILELENLKKEIEKRAEETDIKIKELSIENKRKEEKINEIKRSKEYIDNLGKIKEKEQKQKELEKEIYELKELIDFKYLAGLYHISQKKMDVIREHRDNFFKAFNMDNGNNIMNLLKDTDRYKDVIIDKMKSKREEINNIIIDKDKTNELTEEIKKIILNISNLRDIKERELKKNEKIEEKKQGSVDLLKNKLAEIRVIVE